MASSVDSTRLVYRTASGKPICDGLYLRARAGSMTAIMGPSGAGKSVFLKLLNGYLKPAKGRVSIGGVDPHRQYSLVRQRVGYVPQAEIMIPELTVLESLDYRARLQCPHLKRSERLARVAETCRSLGFEANLDETLRKRIGNPEWRGNYPSGGERRRINLAHELLSRPDVMFLDEPTSGLSTVDAELLIGVLKGQAAEAGMNVIMTIHQPSADMFGAFDDLLLISHGGKVAYYGTAGRAVEYFERAARIKFRTGRNPAEFVVEFVRDRENAGWAAARFEENIRSWTDEFLRLPWDGA